MDVRELITELLDHDMNEDVQIRVKDSDKGVKEGSVSFVSNPEFEPYATIEVEIVGIIKEEDE